MRFSITSLWWHHIDTLIDLPVRDVAGFDLQGAVFHAQRAGLME